MPERSSANPATSPVPLIGRAAELEVLVAQLRRVLAGRSRICLIEDAAGVGKTRLMGEAMASAADFPTVISARSYRGHRPCHTRVASSVMIRALEDAFPVRFATRVGRRTSQVTDHPEALDRR